MGNENRNDGFYLPEFADVDLLNQLTRTSRDVIGRIENHVGVPLFNTQHHSGSETPYIGSWDFVNPHWNTPSVQIMRVDVSEDISSWFNQSPGSCSLSLSMINVDKEDWYEMMNNYLVSNPKVYKLSDRDRRRYIEDQTQKYGVMDRIVVMAGSIAEDKFHYEIQTPLSAAYTYNYHLLNEGTDLYCDFDNGNLVDYHAKTLLTLMGKSSQLQFASWFLTGLVNAESVVDIGEPPVEA